MSNLVIVFGAGASHDVIETKRNRLSADRGFNKNLKPPLTKELFDNRFNHHSENFLKMSVIRNDLRRQVSEKKNIEECLQKIRDRAIAEEDENTIKGLLQFQYYLKNIFTESLKFIPNASKGGTNYCSLLNEIRKRIKARQVKEVSLITFNYDKFLDYAVQHTFNLEDDYKSIESYYSDDKEVKLFKVHGSVDWAYFLDNGSPEAVDVNSAIEIIIHHGYIDGQPRVEPKLNSKYIDPYNAVTDGEPPKIILPALAIPILNDKRFIIEEHKEIIKKKLEEADTIVIIGWSASDEHFTDMIKKHVRKKPKPKLFIVDYYNAGDVKEISKFTSKFISVSNPGMPWDGADEFKFWEKGFSDFATDPDKLNKVFS